MMAVDPHAFHKIVNRLIIPFSFKKLYRFSFEIEKISRLQIFYLLPRLTFIYRIKLYLFYPIIALDQLNRYLSDIWKLYWGCYQVQNKLKNREE